MSLAHVGLLFSSALDAPEFAFLHGPFDQRLDIVRKLAGVAVRLSYLLIDRCYVALGPPVSCLPRFLWASSFHRHPLRKYREDYSEELAFCPTYGLFAPLITAVPCFAGPEKTLSSQRFFHSSSWRTRRSGARSGSAIISSTARSMRMDWEPFMSTASPSLSMPSSSLPACWESSNWSI